MSLSEVDCSFMKENIAKAVCENIVVVYKLLNGLYLTPHNSNDIYLPSPTPEAICWNILCKSVSRVWEMWLSFMLNISTRVTGKMTIIRLGIT